MRDLAPPMNAGVGTARALHMDALTAEGEHGVLERRLDRRAGVLALPADERPAIIFDGDLVARHRFSEAGSGAATRRRAKAAPCPPAKRSRAGKRRPLAPPCPDAAA